MRIAVLADIHGNVLALEAALAHLAARKHDLIVDLGDCASGPLWPRETLERLERVGAKTVRGNHDRWLFEGALRDLPGAVQIDDLQDTSLVFLKSLPLTQPLDTVSGRLLLCHGMGANDMQGVTPDDYGYALQVKDELHDLRRAGEFRFVVAGHTHQRMVRRFENLTVINAGTLYRPYDPCVSIADFAEGYVQFHDFEDGAITSTSQRLDCA
jgi:putative phosphoesterase